MRFIFKIYCYSNNNMLLTLLTGVHCVSTCYTLFNPVPTGSSFTSLSGNFTDFISCITNNQLYITNSIKTNTVLSGKQPTAQQRTDAQNFMTTFLSQNGVCNAAIPSSLQAHYKLVTFTDTTTVPNSIFCTLQEKVINSQLFYDKGWPLVAKPLNNGNTRRIHITAPHAWYDTDSETQAADLFVKTKASSFMTTLRARDARTGSTNCLPGGTSDGQTDAANTITELFWNMGKGIVSAVNTLHNGCPWDSCVHIQFHGYSSSDPLCPNQIYLSSGTIATSNYDPTTPIYRLYTNLVSEGFTAQLAGIPSTEQCLYYAPRNTLQRHLNSVSDANICTGTVPAPLNQITWKFVHIEQYYSSRAFGVSRTRWVNAINNAFPILAAWSSRTPDDFKEEL